MITQDKTPIFRLPSQKEKDQNKYNSTRATNFTVSNAQPCLFTSVRMDIQGNPIKKGGKRKTYHISFRDDLLKENGKSKKLVTYISIESYKEYNKTMSYQGKEGREYEKSASGNCCSSGCLIV